MATGFRETAGRSRAAGLLDCDFPSVCFTVAEIARLAGGGCVTSSQKTTCIDGPAGFSPGRLARQGQSGRDLLSQAVCPQRFRAGELPPVLAAQIAGNSPLRRSPRTASALTPQLSAFSFQLSAFGFHAALSARGVSGPVGRAPALSAHPLAGWRKNPAMQWRGVACTPPSAGEGNHQLVKELPGLGLEPFCRRLGQKPRHAIAGSLAVRSHPVACTGCGQRSPKPPAPTGRRLAAAGRSTLGRPRFGSG